MELRCVFFNEGTESVDVICMLQMGDGQDDYKERRVESRYFLFISALYYSFRSFVGKQLRRFECTFANVI